MTAIRNAQIVQFGIGGVGRALLEQVLATREGLVKRRGVRLEYIGLVDSTGYLRAVPRTTLMGSLKGTDNVITLYTRRYNRRLVICGAGPVWR